MRSNASRALLCLLVAACLLPAGCNNGRRLQTQLIQRELRLQEDEIYRLEDYISEYQAIVRDYRREVCQLKKQLEEQDESPGASTGASAEPMTAPRFPDSASETSEAPPFQPPTDASPVDEAPPFENNEPLEEAPPFQPEAGTQREPLPLPQATNNLAAPIATVAAEAAPFRDPKPLMRAIAVAPGTDPKPSGAPSGIALENGPEEADGSSTLLVRVTLPEAWGPQAITEASVMLTARSQAGLHRLARWDYHSDEIEQAWNGGEKPGYGFLLQLPSEAEPGRPLQLWLRLIDSRGRKLLRSVEVVLEGTPPRLAGGSPAAEAETAPPMSATASDDGWRRAASPVGSRSPERYDPAVRTVSHTE